MAVPKRLLKAIEKGNVKKFYLSKEWKRKRQEILQKNHFECELCKKEGKVNGGEDGRGKNLVVHHKKHLKARPDLGLTDNNLLVCCPEHHNKLHPEKSWGTKEKKEPLTPERW